MEPEELGLFLIKYVYALQNEGRRIHRYNDLVSVVGAYSGEDRADPMTRRLLEAWTWLQYELCLAPDPTQSTEGWVYVTERGRQLAEHPASVHTFQAAKFLPPGTFHPTLEAEARPAFIRGAYDLAVFSAFRAVEIEVRRAAELSENDYGVDLIDRAFKPHEGPLAHTSLPESEQVRMRELFRGAVGVFKNPSSHRAVNYTDPLEVVGIIRFADVLMRVVGRRATERGGNA